MGDFVIPENNNIRSLQSDVIKNSPEYQECVYRSESVLFRVSFVISLLLWILLCIPALIYGPFVFLGIVVTNAIFLSYVRGYGMKISTNQFPEIHNLVLKSSERLGFKEIPDVYIYNMDGLFNAFATHFFSRNFVILTTAILDACDEDLDKVNFILTHEIAHLQRGHTRWNVFLMPSKLIPWLGNAYSKACEYTCDAIAARFGLENDIEKAIKAVALLPTANKKRADKVNFEAYEREQFLETGSFWMTLAETNSSHPYSSKRVINLRNVIGKEGIRDVKRNIFGILMAPMFSLGFLILIYFAFIWFSISADMQKRAEEKARAKTNVEYDYRGY